MKELSIEEKAKAYDDALEKARQLCAYPTTKPFINDLQDLFPELKESEDEKTRKRIIALVNAHGQGMYKDEMLAWLEKQGEQKPAEWSEEDEVKINRIVACLENLNVADNDILLKDVDWLKSLRLQNGWIRVVEKVYVKEPVLAQKKDKSDPFGGFVVCCDHTLTPNVYERYMILGNIVSQNTWKPSEEQMKFLSKCIEAYNEVTFPTEVRVLSSLYNDLKKLKG